MKLLRKVLLISLMLTMIFGLNVSAYQFVSDDGPDYDFGGDTLTIASYLANWYFDWEQGQDLAHLKAVEDRYNVKIEFTYQDDWKVMLQDMQRLILAGDKPFDVVFLQTLWIPERGIADFLLPLQDIVPDDYFDRMPAVGAVNKDQQIWWQGNMLALNQPGSRVIMSQLVWNKTFFEREGLPDLYELVENGEWTWDAFKEITQKATRDLDGDGVPDQWGFAQMEGNRYKFWFSPYTNNASPYKDVDGRLVFTGTDPEFIEALQFGRWLYESGVMHPDETIHGNRPDWHAGKVAMYDPYIDYVHEDMEDDFGVVPYPMGPNATEYASTSTTTHCIGMPINQERPEAVLEVITALYGFAEPHIDKAEYEDYFWDDWAASQGNSIRDWETVETMRDMTENVQIIFDPETLMSGYNNAVRTVLVGEKSAAAAMGEFAPVAQSNLDSRFND